MGKNKQPILSICIPTYNRRYSLKHTLESIIEEKEFLSGNVEVIICDNASSDGTSTKIKEFLSKYSNIKYCLNSQNIGPMPNINKTISLGNGEYLWYFSSHVKIKKGILSDIFYVIKKKATDIIVLSSTTWEFNILKGKNYENEHNTFVFQSLNEYFEFLGNQYLFDNKSFPELSGYLSTMSLEILSKDFYDIQRQKIVKDLGNDFYNNYNFNHWFTAYYKNSKVLTSVSILCKKCIELSYNEKNDKENEKKSGWNRSNPRIIFDVFYFTKYLKKTYGNDLNIKNNFYCFLNKHKKFWLLIFLSGLLPIRLKNLFSNNIKKKLLFQK